MKTNYLQNAIKVISVLLCICLVFIAILSLDALFGAQGGTATTVYEAQKKYFDGKPYKAKTVVNYLLIGMDKYDYNEEITGSGSYNNEHTADFLLLLSVDLDEDGYTLIEINRDTMTDVDILGLSGKVTGSDVMQIALAYSYGNGLTSSAINTVHAVSDYLENINLVNYVAMNMTAVSKLCDFIGGVEVTLTENQNYTSINEAWVPNAKINLTGRDAFSFISARMTVDDGTNISRMARQQQFMEALLTQSDKLENLSTSSFLELYESISPYFFSNCNEQELKQIFSVLGKYEYKGMKAPAGTSVVVDDAMQYIPDTEDVKKIVIETFYKSILS